MEDLYAYDLASFFITMGQLGIPVDIKKYMEIGVSDGDSTLNVLRQYPDIEKLVLCDNWSDGHGGTGRGDHMYVEARLRGEANFHLSKVTWLDGDSNVKIPEYFGNYPCEQFDVIVVDDDHSIRTLSNHLDVVIGHADFIVCHDVCMEGLANMVYLKYLLSQGYVLLYDNLTLSRWAYFVRRQRL